MAAISLTRMLANGDTLNAQCLNVRGQLHDPPFSKPPCSHGATIDLAWLIGKVGTEPVDLYSSEVQALFVCKRCGSRGASFIGSPPSWSISTAGREQHYAETQKDPAPPKRDRAADGALLPPSGAPAQE